MPDLVEPGRQHVHQEPPDKLLGAQRHHFFLVVVLAVLVSEGDLSVSDVEDSPVADGDAVGVPAEVLEHLFGATHRGFCVGHPSGFVQFAQQGFERAVLGKRRCAAVIFQSSGLPHLLEGGQKLAPEQSGHYPDGNKKAFFGGLPGSVWQHAAARHDTVDMGVEVQLLSPGVEDCEHSRPGAEPLGLPGQLVEGFPGTAHEQVVEGHIVAQEQGVERMWDGEHDMEIGRVEQFAHALLHPLDLR